VKFHYFEEGKADKKDFQLQMAIQQGYVPKTCLLGGAVVMSEVMCFNFRTPDARRFAWWLLWKVWIVGTWCGLRRNLWYWALSVRCSSYSRLLTPSPGTQEKAGNQ
jgi:hypothetical protein